MHLNFELNLYVAKLLIIVWFSIPYLTIKYIEYFRSIVDDIWEYFLWYILLLLVIPPLVVLVIVLLGLTYQAIYPIFNILFLTW